MVSGKPCISVKSATIKAENSPSRAWSWGAKLNAKIMNTAELIITPLRLALEIVLRRGQRVLAGPGLFPLSSLS